MYKSIAGLVWFLGLFVVSFSMAQPNNDKVFVRWIADKRTAYQGESILLQLKLYYESSVTSPDVFTRLTIPNGWVREIKQKATPSEERLNGKTYGVVILKQYLVIPQKSGTVSVPAYPVTIQVTLAPKPDDFCQVEQTITQSLTAPELTLTIRALPDPKPASFAGAVGRFTWQVKVEKDSIRAQTPVRLTFRIAGQGNFPFVALPPMTLPTGLEGFEVTGTDEQQITAKGITGNKTFSQTIVGEQAGKYTLPFVFTYFDPTQQKYITRVDSVHLQMTDTTKNSISPTVKTPVVQTIPAFLVWHPSVPAFKKKLPFFHSAVFWLLCLLPAIFCAAWGWVYLKKQQQRAVRYPYRQAVQALQKLKRQSGRVLPQANAQQVESILFRYCATRYSISSADWHSLKIQEILQAYSVEEAVIRQVQELLERCNEMRFSNSDFSITPVRIEEVILLLQKLEKQSRIPAKRMLATGWVLAIAGVLIGLPSWATTPAAQYRQAQHYYQAQQYDSAVTILCRLVQQGVADKAVYTNLANAYFQSGKTGLAILNYEKARRLAPADSLVALNLKTIRQKLNLVAPVESPLTQWLAQTNLTLLVWISVALLWVGGVLLVFKILFDKNRWLPVGWLCCGLGIIGLASTWLVHFSRENSQTSIVITATTGYYAPSIQARELVRLPEGSAVTVEDIFAGWAKVSIPDGRRVWIPLKAREEI